MAPKQQKEKSLGIPEILASVAITAAAFFVSGYLPLLEGWSYAGAFLVGLVSSATLFLPAPGWAIIAAFGRTLDPITLGIFAGIGSGIGELTGFLLGRGGSGFLEHRLLGNGFAKRQIDFVKSHSEVAVFLLALVPNPLFDIAGIAAGAIKMPWWKFLAATILGKIIKFAILAYLGKLSTALV
ncbi:VTT domain-containing protein [Candidatus Parvarchaeota archaeon]|nr:VTT domain-containing protein [Candidatus Parvarchaeota archaeon]